MVVVVVVTSAVGGTGQVAHAHLVDSGECLALGEFVVLIRVEIVELLLQVPVHTHTHTQRTGHAIAG